LIEGSVKAFTLRSALKLGSKRANVPTVDKGEASVQPIDATQPVPFPFRHSPVIVAIDIEADERPGLKKNVTEIGIAVLDTNNLHGIAPGPGGEEWFKYIRGHHFRIKEQAHVVNYYSRGCPDRFEFGTSEFVVEADAAAAIESCIRRALLKPANANASTVTLLSTDTTSMAERNVVFVGHDPGQDIEWLKQVGYNLPPCLTILDTAQLYKSYSGDKNTRSIETIIARFGLVPWHVHNAGNDAVYTMQIYIGTAIRAAAGDDSGKTGHGLIEGEIKQESGSEAKE
jgi:hypothetical protein